MKQPEALVDKVTKSNSQLLVTLNGKGDYLFVNQVFSNAFFSGGSTHFKHHSFVELVSPEHTATFNEALAKCLSEPGEIFIIQLDHSASANKSITVHWEMHSYHTGDDNLVICKGTVLYETPAPGFSLEDVGINSNSANALPVSILQNIFNYSLDVICATNEVGRFVAVSHACKRIWGYEPEEIIGKPFTEFVYQEDLEKTFQIRSDLLEGKEVIDFENRLVRKDGTLVTMLWTAKWNEVDRMMYSAARDGSKTREYESTIKASEEKYKLIFYKNPQPMWIYDEDTFYFLEVNEAAISNYGYSREEFLAMTIMDIRTPEEVEKLVLHVNQPIKPSYKTHWRHKKKDGNIMEVEITAYSFHYEGRRAKLVLSNDITKHLRAESELLKSNERYNYASKASIDAIWDWDMRSNEVYWSENYETLFGYKPVRFQEPLKEWIRKIYPDEKARIERKFLEAIRTNVESWEDEYRFRKADNTYAYVMHRGIIIRNKTGRAYRMIGVLRDYTDKQKNEQSLKELNASLEKRASELASSNQELERFAYVASHDLQEPLRMVSSFLQLLQKRYKEQLDAKANEYIHFAVDGAERMKVLILDLLKYSRVNTMKEEHEQVDLNEVCKNLVFTLTQLIKETKATIDIEPLPTVLGTKTQLVQLFQNLVANAMKYKSKEPPRIKIGAIEQQEFWQFYVQDNGLGIDSRFFDKIFVIFQRLHHKDEYSGTGIGLAICKKIVERHGGKIWVESTPGKGSTFYFTLNKHLKRE